MGKGGQDAMQYDWNSRREKEGCGVGGVEVRTVRRKEGKKRFHVSSVNFVACRVLHAHRDGYLSWAKPLPNLAFASELRAAFPLAAPPGPLPDGARFDVVCLLPSPPPCSGLDPRFHPPCSSAAISRELRGEDAFMSPILMAFFNGDLECEKTPKLPPKLVPVDVPVETPVDTPAGVPTGVATAGEPMAPGVGLASLGVAMLAGRLCL